MSLASGTRLGVYEIVAPLGAGGMGVVYRARDTRLGRTVALKILHDAVSGDPDRISRFEREAKLLASLNHPNIAALYGMDHSEERHVLVMELVEGETLADRVRRGPVPLDEALAIAVQIADALDTAHEQGVVHRDLKPANVKVTEDGKVKVLDFGLAKAMESGAASSNVTNSPTLSMMATQAGIILGTAAYMSPEQAKGAPADQRSDIFSLGVVLYEMLVGRPPFAGDTAPEVMANVLVREADLALLPSSTHHRLRDLLRRCLEKQPKKRWQAIGDVRAELESIAAAPTAPVESAVIAARPLWQRLAVLGAVIVATAAISAYAAWRLKPAGAQRVMRFSIPFSDAERARLIAVAARSRLAVSPDGSQLAVVVSRGSNTAIAVRGLGDLEHRVVPGTETSSTIASPVFSPDGEWLAFWSNAAIKKVAVRGGSPMTLVQLAENPFSLSWSPGWLLYPVTGQDRGIYRVSENGGEPERLIALDPPAQATGASLIDQNRAVLYAVTSSQDMDRWDKADIVVQRIGSSERTVVVRGGTDPRYLPSGHLVYVVAATLLAVPVDERSARVLGPPVPVLEGVARPVGLLTTGVAHYAVSSSGLLAYVPGPSQSSAQLTLALVNRDGAIESLPIQPRVLGLPRVSPDGKRVAFVVTERESQIWMYTLGAGNPARPLTLGGNNSWPIWTPDGRHVTFQSDRDGAPGIYRLLADGSGTPEPLTRSDASTSHVPESWSPDGKILLYRVIASDTQALWTMPTTGDRTPKPFAPVAKGRAQAAASFSPDGRWVAYGSNERGGSAYYVFVEPFPRTGAKYQVTTTASSTPVWSRDGRQLFYAFANRVFAIDVRTTPEFQFGQATQLPSEESLTSGPTMRSFDVMPDGRLLLAVAPGVEEAASRSQASQVNVVINWFEELKAKVPVR